MKKGIWPEIAVMGLLGFLTLSSPARQQAVSLPRAEDLVIYEIAVKGFTSPNGPGSGTFDSLREKIPYLADLGINAVWLSPATPAPTPVISTTSGPNTPASNRIASILPWGTDALSEKWSTNFTTTVSAYF